MALEMNGGDRPRGGSRRLGRVPRPWWLRSPNRTPDEVEQLLDLPDGASLDDEPPIDLSLLAGDRLGAASRGAQSARWEELVARIERAAEPELARRARLTTGVLDFVPLLARSVRPALVATAAALVLGIGLARFEAAVESTDLANASAAAPLTAAADPVAGQLLSDVSDERQLLLSTSDEAWLAQLRAPSTGTLVEAIGLGEVDQ